MSKRGWEPEFPARVLRSHSKHSKHSKRLSQLELVNAPAFHLICCFLGYTRLNAYDMCEVSKSIRDMYVRMPGFQQILFENLGREIRLLPYICCYQHDVFTMDDHLPPLPKVQEMEITFHKNNCFTRTCQYPTSLKKLMIRGGSSRQIILTYCTQLRHLELIDHQTTILFFPPFLKTFALTLVSTQLDLKQPAYIQKCCLDKRFFGATITFWKMCYIEKLILRIFMLRCSDVEWNDVLQFPNVAEIEFESDKYSIPMDVIIPVPFAPDWEMVKYSPKSDGSTVLRRKNYQDKIANMRDCLKNKVEPWMASVNPDIVFQEEDEQ